MTAATDDVVRSSDSGVSLIEFVEPIAGFAGERVFTLTPIDEAGAFYSLRSVATPTLRFILLVPAAVFADYAPKVPAGVLDAVGADHRDDAVLFVIVTVQKSLADATANLRAPIVVSTSHRHAVQVVLEHEGLSFREPLAR